LSEEEARIQTVRWNALRGEPDPIKFLELWNGLLKRHDAEVLRAKMGLTRAKLKSYLPKVTKGLPDEIRQRVDEPLDDIETVQDLTEIVRQAMLENKDRRGKLQRQMTEYEMLLRGKHRREAQKNALVWTILHALRTEKGERVDFGQHAYLKEFYAIDHPPVVVLKATQLQQIGAPSRAFL